MYSERRPNPDRSPESLEARLRALAQPPIPADLEARLLATIPAEMPIPQRRRAVWVGLAGAAAAACLLTLLAWPRGDGKNPAPRPGPIGSAHQSTARPPRDLARIAAWQETRVGLDGAEVPPFIWPLEETSPIRATSIPPELLE
ncbi:MAG TPA: hypothetical protein VGZ22_26470 [Isosphaeraceae bacterium]|jgi:hypothetical protein|nr:hypothetical protein [Isosphaeraceae bacterium]